MLTKDDFEIYHKNNPQVYEMFEKFALEAINSGRPYFGAGAIYERMRWYTAVEAKDEEFKLCNNYRAFYSRLFEDKHPEWKGFFRKRRSIADERSEREEKDGNRCRETSKELI